MYFQSLVQLFVHHGLLIKSWTNSTASLQSQYTIAFNAGWLWLGFFSTTFMFASPRLQELTKWHLGAKGLHSSEIFRAFYPLHITKLPSDHPFPLLLVRTLKQFWGMNWWHTFILHIFPRSDVRAVALCGNNRLFGSNEPHDVVTVMWFLFNLTENRSNIANRNTIHCQSCQEDYDGDKSHTVNEGIFFLHISITLIQPTRDVTSI